MYLKFCIGVARHAGRVIYLRYKGSGPIKKTVYLVGKGVTYDTGGCDIKAGGVMAGMHRDKCIVHFNIILIFNVFII